MTSSANMAALSAASEIAIIGCGAMGAGIAQVAASAGHPVKLFDARPDAANQAIAGIHAIFDKLVSKGKMSQADAQAASLRLTAANALDEMANADLVIEAIVENLDAKRNLFAQLEAVVSDQCILASNTSSISITSIGAKLRLPNRLIGMHFFNPVPLMALVEVIKGLASDQAVAETIYATCIAWGKNPVHTTSTPGFIVNRVARPYYAESLRSVTEQAGTPATIDAVLRESGGFRMGPFELMDLIGNDINFSVTNSVFNSFFHDQRFTPSLLQQELVNAGYLGRKSGRGFYQYGEDAPAIVPQNELATSAPAMLELQSDQALANLIDSKLALISHSSAISVSKKEFANEDGVFLKCGLAHVYITDGRSATQRSADNAVPDTVLIDLALDYAKATRIALTRADQCSDAAFQEVVGLFQLLGYAVSSLGDIPGMAVMRTVAMLINEAADTVNQGVCSVTGVDTAMKKGVNYPIGPLAWADRIGVSNVKNVLYNLGHAYGEDRYRISPLIHRKVAGKRNFHG